MEYTSVFDIIGPVMVGPSSSHTAGALEISRYGRKLFGIQPQSVEITLYNSFAKTYKGHGTDVALVAGILDFSADDLRIPQAIEIATEEGIEIEFVVSIEDAPHPNTAKLTFRGHGKELIVTGISIGGGSFKIISEEMKNV